MANAKDFFTVFPDLKLTKVLNDLFLQVQVEKIVACREANSIKVHIYSEKLIENKDLTVVTKAMKDQLFSNGNITVSINCRFKLSDMYTPKNLYEAYKESILEEIRNTSIIMYTILKKDKIEFEGNDMIISVEETTINCAKLEDLRKILQEIFNDRCDVNVNISFKMIEPVLDKYTKKNEIISENQSKLISRQFAIVNSKNEEGENNVDSIVGGDGSTKNNDDTKESIKDAGKETEKNTGKTAEDTKSAGKGKFGDSQKKVYGNYRREKFTTRADNPDVIFGRSFDGDIMPLSEVNAETGETIIHGEIISVETREIRNERTIVTFSITDYTDSIKSKLFVKNDELVETLDGIKKGNFIKLK